MRIRPRFHIYTQAALSAAACALALSVASEAHAGDCSALPNPVYGAGSSAAKPFIAAVAKSLVKASTPVTVIYKSGGTPSIGSCDGIGFLTSTTPGMITGTAAVWGTDGVETTCDLATSGTPVDIGISDVYAATCPGAPSLPSGVKDFLGPIQTMTFVVPGGSTSASSETVISAEAAYMVMGFGSDSEAPPWTDNAQIARRNEASGTQQMIATAIKVPAAKWKGIDTPGGSAGVVSAMASAQAAGNQDKAIGILATDVADKNRSTLKILGYQHFDQECAYWPDTDDQSFDKANVRDGHYYIWGPLHMLARTGSDGQPSKENARDLIAYLSGSKVPTDFDLITIEAQGGVVPSCAMHVKRTEEVGALMSFQPDQSCSCKFTKEATGSEPSECKTCDKASDCPTATPACNFGYCEVK